MIGRMDRGDRAGDWRKTGQKPEDSHERDGGGDKYPSRHHRKRWEIDSG